MAQLVECSIPIPEVHSLNPVIGKNLFILNICLLSTVYCKHENKEKRGREWPIFLKKEIKLVFSVETITLVDQQHDKVV